MSQRQRARARKKKPAAKPAAIAREKPGQSNLGAWLLGGLLVAAVVLAYRNAWTAGYIWDDDLYVTKNPLITAADGWRRIWFSFDAPSQYFPLTYSTFRIEHWLWRFNSAGYHWVNILLHATNALLLWRVLRVLKIPGAWFAAALFALHPVQVESVAWISERKNVLMGLFFFSSLLAWLRFVDAKTGRPWRWLALSLLLYVCALSAKTTACTLPAALVLVLWWQHKPLTMQRWLQIAPFVLAGIGAGLISILWERIHQGGRPDYIPIGLLERVLIFSRAIWFYLSKLAWPSELIFSYPRWEISPSDPTAYFWLLLFVVLIAAIVCARRKLGRGPEVAFIFFIATLGPLLGLTIVITFLYSFVADHYQYLACIGPLTLLAASAASLRQEWIARAVTIVVLPLLFFLTWQQTKTYRNEETLWLRTIAQNPSSWMARNNLAALWVTEKKYEAAVEQYRTIIENRPDDSLGYANLGAAFAREGQFDAAIAQYDHARRLEPDDPRIERNLANSLVVLGRVDDAIPHFQRALELRGARKDSTGAGSDLQTEFAIALMQKGELEKAREHLQEATSGRADDRKIAEAYRDLGNAFLQKRDLENAAASYREALARRPDYAEVHSNFGTALLLQGKFAEAISEFDTTLKFNPQSAFTLNNLARLLATVPNEKLRDGNRAARLAQQAIDLTGGRDPASFRALAAALAEKGEFTEAENAADKAISLAGVNNPAFVEVLRHEKEVYRDKQKPAAR